VICGHVPAPFRGVADLTPALDAYMSVSMCRRQSRAAAKQRIVRDLALSCPPLAAYAAAHTVNVQIISVRSWEARPLRQEVLRPGQSVDAVTYTGDDATDTLHAAALDDAGVIGVATVVREAPPDSDQDDAWHLRGMAVLPEHQRRGCGTALVASCLAHVRCHGGTLVWCNARVGAMDFYRLLGFRTVGQRFHLTGAGDHYRMVRTV
jgi:ribosomal protein S18 acetylase RimI-like enzyme